MSPTRTQAQLRKWVIRHSAALKMERVSHRHSKASFLAKRRHIEPVLNLYWFQRNAFRSLYRASFKQMQEIKQPGAHCSESGVARFPVGAIFLVILGVALAGYAVFGRGFAYLGVPPIYVGELVMLLGLLTWVLTGGGGVFQSWIARLILALMSWGVFGTVQWVGTYGLDALRDAVIWGYATFALLVGTLLLRKRDRILTVVQVYANFIPWFLVAITIGLMVRSFWVDYIPVWPSSNVPVWALRSGEIGVHLAGVMAFMALGLHRLDKLRHREKPAFPEWLLWVIWLGALTMIIGHRAAILTIAGTALLLVLIRPTKRWAKMLLIAVLAVPIAVTTHIELRSPQSERVQSAQALLQTVSSIFSEQGEEYRDGSRRWRLEWWSDIVEYTVFGDYFWTGKGYGINLADDDGYQVFSPGDGQPVLRSPHNGHLTVLARSGVPGLFVWVMLQGTFAMAFLRAYRRAKLSNREYLARVNLWVLAYWFAFIINASFDVFLEGPQGGIWFWSLFGFGIALLVGQRKRWI